MKQPKKPTYQQKKRIAAAGLEWSEWSVISESEEELIVKAKQSDMMLSIRADGSKLRI